MGQRRCQLCEMFIQWEGLWCPCCGVRLRTKPRVGTLREKLRKKLGGEFNLEECNHEKIVDDQFRIRTFVLEEEEYK